MALSAAFVGEHLSLLGWSGIVTLAAGVLLLAARGGHDIVQLDRRAVGYALLTALTICAYSVTDGIGVRLSRNPLAYVLWLFVANAIALVPYALWRDRSRVTAMMHRFWLRGLTGGALQALSYGIVLWAMTLAPIALSPAYARPAFCSVPLSRSSSSRSRCEPRASRQPFSSSAGWC
jgi:drug/metabolite transporter (DMT)-like permease